jgi:polysaccharide export outer membrane protein
MEQRNFLNFLWALFLVTSIFLFLVSSLPAASAPAVTGPTSRLPTPEEIAKIPLIKASDLQKGNTRDITTPNMEDYVLGPGDVLEIRIWGQPELTLSRYRIQTLPDFMVAPDGKVFVPVIGDIQVAGKTLSEVRSEITRRVSKYYRDVNIAVVLKILGSFKVYVLGEVVTPGLYSVLVGDYYERKLMRFISQAYGFTTLADKRRVLVIRTNLKTGEQKIIECNIEKLNEEGDLSQNIDIQKGDTILVPQTINNVYVFGEVRAPGAYQYIRAAKLIDYVSIAGGLSTGANGSNIGVIRGRGREAVVIKASMNNLVKWGREAPDFKILPGDIIFVPKNFLANWSDILNVLGLVEKSFVSPRNARDAYYDLQKSLRSPVTYY